jgi:hypothetical protein
MASPPPYYDQALSAYGVTPEGTAPLAWSPPAIDLILAAYR